ncbi:MAG: 30S ribosomal protein S2 [Candidatus Aenigmarchaeota archaeon]|nr:30S ribosomal protein S2 [Candidatus Aenigmarchaeota archaeon]
MPIRFLIPRSKYLASGIHIGMKQKTKQIEEFIYNIRPDGLAVFNLKKVDERIRIAAKFLARCTNILVTSRKPIVFQPIKKFCELIKCKVVTGRFMPGMLTNPSYEEYFEANVVLVVDPLIDFQAIQEAVKARVPVVALCDTFNETKDIDLIIPCNNVGKRAIATIFWLLAREILKERKEIKSDREFKHEIESFEAR